MHDRNPEQQIALSNLAALTDGFFGQDDVTADCHPIEPDELPVAVRPLLVHHEHMTLTLRSYHQQDVALQVLQHRVDGDAYRRQIVLVLTRTREVVELGVVRLDLRQVAEDVRKEILARETPLGDILVNHNVLRRIEPRWYLRFGAGSPVLDHFAAGSRDEAFGRLGVIHCHDRPVIELLEVVPGASSQPRGPRSNGP